jgi:3-oxoacyl-[acyl-carrier protein] reductase
MDGQYQDKTALITGASSGIGAAIAEELARRGATVVLVARTRERLEEQAAKIHAAGGRAECLPCDVTDENAIRKMARQLHSQHGKIHLIVNNAGLWNWSPMSVLPMDEVERMFRLNVFAMLNVVRLMAALLPKGSGAVVNMCSTAALQGESGLAAYSATKGAIMAMTRSLAKELAPRRVRVNAVAPGVVLTEGTELRFNVVSQERRAELESKYPLGFGKPTDVAPVVAFLGSDDARWITGQTLVVDGGLTC